MSAKITRPQLDAIRARCEAATPGPWLHVPGLMFKHYVCSENGDLGFSLQELHPEDGREWATAECAAFIACARTDVPALLDYIADLEARLGERQEDTEVNP